MAKQSTTAGRQETPQGTDLILLHDKVDKLLKAVSALDKDGNHKTVPFDDEHRNSFLKIDKGANWLESFWKNLVSQFKDPTHFNLVSIQEAQLDDPKIRQALKDLAAGKETKEAKEFLDKYEIRAKEPAQAQDNGIDWEALKKEGITREGLEKLGLLDDFLAKHAKDAPARTQETRFNESLIDWEGLKNLGLSREFLVQRELLPELLQGYKSRELVPMVIDTGLVRARIEGRIGLMNSSDGLKFMVWGVKQKPAFDRPFHGHVFSADDKLNLMETGNMGRTVELARNGENVLSFVSRDRLTNDLYAVNFDDVFFPKEVKNIELSEHEINELREGRSIKVEGFVSDKGNEYSATLQVNAERRGVEFIFENNGQFNAEKLGGVELSQQQRDELNAGKTILMEGMVGKDSGVPYDRFVKLDETTGKPHFYQFNPDSPENARQIVIPRELGGQRLSEEDRLELREGKVIHVKDMESQRGESLPPFVRVDLQTGRVQYSYDPNKFEEQPRFEVPQEVKGVKLSSIQRAQLQDGKAVLIEGIKGFDGKIISQYAKVNRNQSGLDYSNDNPDTRQGRSQRGAQSQRQEQPQKRGRSI